METLNKKNILKDFDRFTIILGSITLSIGIISSFLPAIWLSSHFDIPVTFAEVMNAFLPILVIFGVTWFSDGLVMYPIIGLAGTYLGWLTGNVSNLRLPCSVAAQITAGVKEGTEEGGIISVIAIAVSSFTTIIVLGISAATASFLLNIIPEPLQVGFNFFMPALMGGLVAQFGLRNLKLLGVAFIITFFTQLVLVPMGYPSTLVSLTSVIGTVVVGVVLYQRAKKKNGANNGIDSDSSEE